MKIILNEYQSDQSYPSKKQETIWLKLKSFRFGKKLTFSKQEPLKFKILRETSTKIRLNKSFP